MEKYEVSREEYFEKASKIAIDSLKKFFRCLGLDETLFEHLYSIEYVFNDSNSYSAMYDPNENIIYVSESFFRNSYFEYITTSVQHNGVLNNYAVNIVHELIHANRTCLISNSLNKNNIYSKIFNYKNNNNKNFDRYMHLFEESLSKDYVKDFYVEEGIKYNNKEKKIIPIIIESNKEDKLVVIVYNTQTKNFEKYRIIDNIAFTGYGDEYMKQMIDYLNFGKFKGELIEITENEIEKNNLENADSDYSMVLCDYYHQYYDKLVNNNSFNDDNTLNFENIFEYQNAFEESMTELIVYLVIMLRNYNDEIDNKKLIEMCNKIIESTTSSKDEKLTAYLFSKFGVDMIKWFMLSAYSDSYYDNLYSKLSDNNGLKCDKVYYELLSVYSRLSKNSVPFFSEYIYNLGKNIIENRFK